jgi:transposase
MPLSTDKAVLSSSTVMAKALCTQLKATLEAIEEFDRQIAQVCSAHEDYELFESLPGAGAVYAARLAAALGSDRTRWQSAQELACLVGVAPVMERSGQSCWVR